MRGGEGEREERSRKKKSMEERMPHGSEKRVVGKQKSDSSEQNNKH